jgi:class 3 adenylate cyclase
MNVGDGERRQVTVLFADLVGFTTFSERAGEEAAYRLMQRISALLTEVVHEQRGTVKSFTGDGIMALFGFPSGFEDAPLKACRAALLIQQRLVTAASAIEEKYGLRPQLRIGINTGPVIIGNIESGDASAVTALGDTVNLASRLQVLAEPGSVILSGATQRLVEGMVESHFAGEHQIKGKAEPQRIFRLGAMRQGAVRFDAAVSRGLTSYLGRERELEVLERGLAEARFGLRVIDVMAEPGMGKSRLLYEFRQRIGKDRAFILQGSCSSDGKRTPFLPFIEVVRRSFQVSAGEAEKEVTQKLEMGLTALGLRSLQNLGLLLNLLGLKAPQGALAGLDGVLTGLRTRDLLYQLLETRCRLSLVVMLLEDLHWIDSASEELLSKIVEIETKPRLLLVHTRRPEYVPTWHKAPTVTGLRLEPLPAGDIRRLIQARLGVQTLPEVFARQVTEKAEGNALFAEEIVSYLSEQGVLRVVADRLDFDANAISVALPASVQTLLAGRIDGLAPQDRVLLQAASVIGRRFDPGLLATILDDVGDIDMRLAALCSFDLIYAEGKSGDFAFKHALVRDALYQSLLRSSRAALHLKIGHGIERRTGNRLAEVAEVLAHHYRHTDRSDKAFNYLAMAGVKCLGIYSLDEAETHFASALSLLDRSPGCATDGQVAELIVHHSHGLNSAVKFRNVVAVIERYLPRLEPLGDDTRLVRIRHEYVFALTSMARYRDAQAVQQKATPMARRLGDHASLAYSLAGEMLVSTTIAPKSVEEFQELARDAIVAASKTDDAYIQYWVRAWIAWEEFHRGHILNARRMAQDMMEVGHQLNDPRSIGLGLVVLGWTAIVGDDYHEGLRYHEESLKLAATPYERLSATNGKLVALALLRRTEAFPLLRDWMEQCKANGWDWQLSGADGIWAICLVLQGNIGQGIRWMTEAISRREQEGYRAAADWYRAFLCEIYLEIIAGTEKPSLMLLMKNFLTLIAVISTAPRRILSLVSDIRRNPRFDPNGHHIGRSEMIVGLLYKAKKKRALAIQHLTEAKRIISQFGHTPTLAKIEAALGDLG